MLQQLPDDLVLPCGPGESVTLWGEEAFQAMLLTAQLAVHHHHIVRYLPDLHIHNMEIGDVCRRGRAMPMRIIGPIGLERIRYEAVAQAGGDIMKFAGAFALRDAAPRRIFKIQPCAMGALQDVQICAFPRVGVSWIQKVHSDPVLTRMDFARTEGGVRLVMNHLDTLEAAGFQIN